VYVYVWLAPPPAADKFAHDPNSFVFNNQPYPSPKH